MARGRGLHTGLPRATEATLARNSFGPLMARCSLLARVVYIGDCSVPQTSQQLSSAGSLQWPATLLYAACATTYVHALFLSAGSETADYHIYYYGCMYFGRTDK